MDADILRRNLDDDHPDVTVFDQAQREVYGLMERDSFTRFVQSGDYAAFLVKQRSRRQSAPEEN